ncbi:hypothetical protein GCM10009627_30220 [Curtobacterium herbarum]|uniref:Uncharacterized protein n=1 Tax=Curtobacterium herbarum TaxID=150122 RepID=A0ABN1ZGL0_9MICO
MVLLGGGRPGSTGRVDHAAGADEENLGRGAEGTPSVGYQDGKEVRTRHRRCGGGAPRTRPVSGRRTDRW